MSSPQVKLNVDAMGRGSLVVDGVQLVNISGVEILVKPGRPSLVRFEMLARIECEIAPDGIRAVVTEVMP